MRIVFFLEERSMKVFLEELLPRCFPELEFLCVAHEGKQDLEKSLRRKLPAWNRPGDHFMIVRDNDGGDCLALKDRLRKICEEADRDALIRLACQELESWYLGDFKALARAFEDDKLLKQMGKKKYRKPDAMGSPSCELEKLIPSFQKVSGARKMGRAMSCANNTSHSFQVFIEGVSHLSQKGAA